MNQDDDFELDPDLDSALDAWEDEFEHQAKAESAPMPQGAAPKADAPKAKPEAPKPVSRSDGRRPLYQPDPELLRGREAPRRAAPVAPAPPPPAERFPSFDDDDDLEESTKIASIPKELIASLQEVAAAREARERAMGPSPEPPPPASPPRSPVPGIDLDLDDLFEGLEQETRLSDLAVENAESANDTPEEAAAIPASERPPTPEEAAAERSIEALEQDFLDPFSEEERELEPELAEAPEPPKPRLPPTPPVPKGLAGLPPRPVVPPRPAGARPPPPAWKPPAPPPGLGGAPSHDASTLERSLDELDAKTSAQEGADAVEPPDALDLAFESPAVEPPDALDLAFESPAVEPPDALDLAFESPAFESPAVEAPSDELDLAFEAPREARPASDDRPTPAPNDPEPSERASDDDEPALSLGSDPDSDDDEPALSLGSETDSDDPDSDDDEPALSLGSEIGSDDDEPALSLGSEIGSETDSDDDEPALSLGSEIGSETDSDDDEPALSLGSETDSDDDEPALSVGDASDLFGGDSGLTALAPPSRSSAAPPPATSVEPTADHGAATAQRTVRQRKPRAERFAFVGRDADTQRRRAELLLELSERATGAAKSRLLTAAAELHERLGAPDDARDAYRRAHEADPTDVVVLRALRRDALKRRDFGEASDHLRAEAELPLGAVDRAHALTLLAELQLVQLGDPTAAEASARAAFELRPSVTSGLLLAEAAHAAGHLDVSTRALADTERTWADPGPRAALSAMLGIAAERRGERAEATERYTALRSSPASAMGALGAARLLEAAPRAEALLAFASTLDTPALAESFRRLAASALLRDDSGAARDALENASRPASLRLRARAARLASDPTTRADTLEALAAATGGTERALALVELAEARAELGDLEAASVALRDAAVADERLDTIRVVREVLSRRAADPSQLAVPGDEAEDETSAVALAARLARGDDRVRERALLDAARERGESPLASELALLDAAAEQGDLDALRSSLRRHVERLTPERRAGALLALSSLLDDAARLDALRAAAEATPAAVTSRALARALAATAPAECARRWEDEAADASGERAFHAWNQAGRAYAAAGESDDARRAFERAFDELPGPSPAAWSLLRGADDDAESLLERILDTASNARAAASAAVSLALLRTDAANLARALEHVERAATLDPALDALVVGHVSMDASTIATLSESRAAASESPPEKRLHLLRAAIAHEQAGDARAAAVALRVVREIAPDPLAASALDRVELAAGEHARVADRRFEAVKQATTAEERLLALEALASLDLHERGDTASGVLTLRSVLDEVPGHLPTLRALERHAMTQSDDEALGPVSQALAMHLPVEGDASAELVAHARASARLILARTEVGGDAADAALQAIGARLGRLTDDWLLRHLAGSASDDATRARWKALRAELASGDAVERVAELLDAAEALEAAEGPGAAALQLAPTGEIWPEDPVTAERRGAWLRAAGEHQDAGRALASAAEHVGDPIHAVRLFYDAGRAFEDAGDAAAASDAYEHAARLDVRFHDLFERARRLLDAQGDGARLAALVALRVEAGADTRTLVELHESQAQIALSLGERGRARDALKAALTLDPQRVDAIERLARLQLEDAEWRGAAESLIRIARLRQDRDELRWVFFTLGDIYDRHLPEPKRAEAAFRRVLKLLPDDLEALDRLASLFERENQHADAVPVLEELFAKEIDPDERHRHLLRLALAHERRGDPRSAEHVLDDARKKSPTDLVVLRALVDLYERQRAPAALAMHLGRATGDFRRLVEQDATSLEAWSGLVEVLDWKDRRDAARVCASVAVALGVQDVAFGSRLDSAGGVPAAGTAAADPDLRDAIAPRMLNRTVFEVFRLAGEAFDKALPFDARAWRAEKLPSRGPSLRDEALRAARIFGIPDVQVLVTSAAPRLCVAVGDRPATILVGHDLAASTTEPERLFLFTRALGIIHAGLAVVMRSQPEAVGLLIGGLLKSIDPMYAPAQIDPKTLDEMGKRIGKNIPRKNRDPLVPLAIEMGGAPGFDPARLGLNAAELGDRLALLALGAPPSAFAALLALAGARLGEGASAEERVAATKKVPEAWSLVRFGISDAHFDARHRAGADRL